MSWLIIAFIVAVALLAPIFGADSRDGRDWRPSTPQARGERHALRHTSLRTSDSRERPSSVRVPVVSGRRVRAGG